MGNHIYSTSKWAKVYAERYDSWRKETLPAYLAVIDEWQQADPQAASDEVCWMACVPWQERMEKPGGHP